MFTKEEKKESVLLFLESVLVVHLRDSFVLTDPSLKVTDDLLWTGHVELNIITKG